MYYLFESVTDTDLQGDPRFEIEVTLKSSERSKLQEYLHDEYLDWLEDGDDNVINGEPVSLYDVENGDLPPEYSDTLSICYSGSWGGAVCHTYQIISQEELDKATEI